MLNTDLNGFISNLKRNDIFNLFILLGICSLLYMMLSMYTNKQSNFTNFSNTYSLFLGYDYTHYSRRI
jgi:hypothetical protein